MFVMFYPVLRLPVTMRSPWISRLSPYSYGPITVAKAVGNLISNSLIDLSKPPLTNTFGFVG